jgi:hypothetical protein
MFPHRVKFKRPPISEKRVQPVAAPPDNIPVTKRIKEGGNNQKEMLLRRGNAINCVNTIPFKGLFLNISMEFRLCNHM